MPRALIGLGSNIGDRSAQLEFAVQRLGETPRVEFVARSRWIETKPVGGPEGQDAFLNGAILLKTTLQPEALFDILQQIEREAGRRREVHWGPRTLDLDLLLYGRQAHQSPRLTIPHPRMAFRRFVLEPAAEVAGDMIHPTTGWTVRHLLRHLRESRRVVALGGPPSADKQQLAELLCERLPGYWVEGGEAEFAESLAITPPDRQADLMLDTLQDWGDIMRNLRFLPRLDNDWRVCDFASVDMAGFVATYSAELVESCEGYFEFMDDAHPPPSLTLLVRPAATSRGDEEFMAQVARLLTGPRLDIETSKMDAAVEEALAAITAME